MKIFKRYIIKDLTDDSYLCSLSGDKEWFSDIRYVLYLNTSKQALEIIEKLEHEGIYKA